MTWCSVSAIAFCISYSYSSSIRSIDIKGNTAWSSREVLEWLSSRPGLAYSESIMRNDVRLIAEGYRRKGYLGARIDAVGKAVDTDSSQIEVTFVVDEGERTVVGGITVSGQQRLSQADILGQFDLKVGEPLDESLLERDIEALLVRYERLGFPFARCQIESIAGRGGEGPFVVDVNLVISEGQRVTIDEIRVEGNSETDPSVVVRETRLVFGQVYNPVKVDAIKQRLRRLNIFSDVSEPQLYLRNERGGLLIKVREGSTNTFDGVIGYVPAPVSGQDAYLTGLVTVSMRNLFGTGRKLSVRWQREDRLSQELGIRYQEPWVFSAPVNAGISFFQRQQDTSYVHRTGELKAELMVSDELSLAALLGSESVIPSADSTINRVYSSSTASVGFEVHYDSRDDNLSPTTGARYQTDYHYGRKRTRNVPSQLSSLVPADATVQRFSLDLDFYLSTFTRQVLAAGIHGRELQSGQLEEGEMFRLGGMKTLRGYRENQFLGSRVVWSNTEYRFLVARRSFLYGFVDAGYYARPADELRGVPKVEAFKYGYGIGAQLETGLGSLGVSFALGQGDSFNQGKIHFGLINDF